MIKNHTLTVKLLMFTICITCIALGSLAIASGYVPARWTRFGYAEALFGNHAKHYGAILLLLGLMPTLVFCKSTKQATVFGSLLFLLLLATIFGGIYLIS